MAKTYNRIDFFIHTNAHTYAHTHTQTQLARSVRKKQVGKTPTKTLEKQRVILKLSHFRYSVKRNNHLAHFKLFQNIEKQRIFG